MYALLSLGISITDQNPFNHVIADGVHMFTLVNMIQIRFDFGKININLIPVDSRLLPGCNQRVSVG